MKAIQYDELGGPEVLKLKDVPRPALKDGEVSIKVIYSALNHLDLHFRRGLPGLPSVLPHIPGSDGVGYVDSVGKGVLNVKIGDRVVIQPGMPCRTCDRCKHGQEELCHKYLLIGREVDGTYAEYVNVPSRNVFVLPEHVKSEQAAGFSLVYLTAWSMIRKAQLKKSQTILIMGAGSGVSMAAIQIAKYIGATVITTASTTEKIKKAKDILKADVVLNYTQVELDKEIRNMTNRKGVDVVLDHIGGEQWVPLLRATRNGGTIVTCGATAGFAPQEDLRQIFYRQLRILGSTMGSDEEYGQALQLFFSGVLSPVVDSIYPLEEAALAQTKMERRENFGKILLKIS